MLHYTPPRETEAVLAGEHPAQGYPGEAHQDDDWGVRGLTPYAHLYKYIGLIDLPCLIKRNK